MLIKVFIFSSSNAPSSEIFIQKQLPLILLDYVIEADMRKADIIIGTGNEFIRFSQSKKSDGKFLILYKPHTELDLRLSYKSFWQLFKALARRISYGVFFDNITYDYSRFQIILCDSRRLQRLFCSTKNAIYLPLSFFPKAEYWVPSKKNLNKTNIGYFGEITHLIECINQLKILDISLKEPINLICFTYGPFSPKLIQSNFNNIDIQYRKFKFDHSYMLEKSLDIDFAICPMFWSNINYMNHSIIKSKFQPNEVCRIEKFSTNSGRAHLICSLGLPLIVSPTEDVVHEFNWLPDFCFFENGEDLLRGYLSLIDEKVNTDTRILISQKFNQDLLHSGILKIRKAIYQHLTNIDQP